MVVSEFLHFLGASFNSNAMLRRRDEFKCTATNKVHFEYLDKSVEFSKISEGTKKVCRDGVDLFC